MEIKKQGAQVVAHEGSPEPVKVNEAAMPAGTRVVQSEGEQAAAAAKEVNAKRHPDGTARVVQSEGERL